MTASTLPRRRLPRLESLCAAVAAVGVLTLAGCSEGDPAFLSVDEEIGATGSSLRKCNGGNNGTNNFCSPGCTCLAGEGDCDTDADCDPGLTCTQNNGAEWGFGPKLDFCEATHCDNGVDDGDEVGVDCGGSCSLACSCPGTNGDETFCSSACLCAAGEGDCDADTDCDAGLECVSNVGESFGQLPRNDVCLPVTCSDGLFNGDEEETDCGGSCIPCVSTALERLSLTATAAEADARTWLDYAVSEDGRYVVFSSPATNIVAGDTNGAGDVFLRDTSLGTIELISQDTGGTLGNGASYQPTVSSNGRYVAFLSAATNLVAGDANGATDVFVRDRSTQTTTRLSVDTGGGDPDGASQYPWISANGRYVSFTSSATDLVASDTNGVDDIFLADQTTGSIERLSVSSMGVQADLGSLRSSISSTGRYIAFASSATNLVTGDTLGKIDIFLRDTALDTTIRLTDSGVDGLEPNNSSIWPYIDSTGTYVLYRSAATNLVAGDTNARYDVFITNRASLVTERVNVATDGSQGSEGAVWASISSSGNIVAFASNSTEYDATDTNGVRDVFIRDRTTGTTTRLPTGLSPNGVSQRPVVSADGRLVIFRSEATNLVAGDTNAVFDLFR
ncbi:MAG: hypothetical protein AAF447_21155, partial [Myxococcota bacterium]